MNRIDLLIFFLKAFLIFLLFLLLSCNNKNYITYYNKVNEIDSIYRFQKDTLTAIKKYRKLFRKYSPKNQERIQEFETFIILADKHNKNFGGKKALQKFIPAFAPYGMSYQKYQNLYSKYGIDSITLKKEVSNWKKNLNKVLVDSFTIAFNRDQQGGRLENEKLISNDKKNADLLKWTLENYGFPSINKIGIIGNNNTFMPMDNFLGHMIQSEYYLFFRDEVLKSVKSGECPPRYYAIMVDKYNLLVANKDVVYGVFTLPNTDIDTLIVDKNRKKIGLPTLKHSRLISKKKITKE